MPNPTCSVQDCDKPVKRQGFCYGHYMKNWRYGTPTPEHDKREFNLEGQRYGALSVIERDPLGGWVCQCDCGAVGAFQTGDLNRGSRVSCGAREHRRSDEAGYAAAHGRVRNLYGSPRGKPCVDCGGPAAHWSYDHADPDERTQFHRGYLMAYSLDPEHYQARCVPCHKTFDLSQIEGVPVTRG